MADVRESFTTLEGSSQEGLALRAVQQGDSVAAKNGSLAFGFNDSTGNAIAPALNASGELPVSMAFQPFNSFNAASVLASVDVRFLSRPMSRRAGIDSTSFCIRMESSTDTLPGFDNNSLKRL